MVLFFFSAVLPIYLYLPIFKTRKQFHNLPLCSLKSPHGDMVHLFVATHLIAPVFSNNIHDSTSGGFNINDNLFDPCKINSVLIYKHLLQYDLPITKITESRSGPTLRSLNTFLEKKTPVEKPQVWKLLASRTNDVLEGDFLGQKLTLRNVLLRS